uniref:G-protein coupled receptors family 1 profile domain-containing protein n=1 Tax=Aquila chrysaetos chrysaetos TaxID=223781 RepID=A0A663EN53_AQUCH
PFYSDFFLPTLVSAGDPCRMSYGSFITPTQFGIICLLAVIGNSSVICTILKKSGPSSSIPDVIIGLSMFFLEFAIPFALITAAYRRILLKMARYSEALASQRCTRAQTTRPTHAAIAICAAFFIFWAPFRSWQLAQLTMTYPTMPFYYNYNTAMGLGYANSCPNPSIYTLLGQNFQRQLGVPVRPAAAGQASPNGIQ